MNFELTEEQREVAKQKIIESAECDMALNDTTGTFDAIKRLAQDIKNGKPISDDVLKQITAFLMFFDMTWNATH